MSNTERGFIVDVFNASKEGYVARLVITPRRDDGMPGVDVEQKLERHIGQHRALGLALELLERCSDVPPQLLEQIRDLKTAARKDAADQR